MLVLLSFLMGSIPFGYLIVKKTKGIDIRTEGSGNIGSTNVKRVAGKKIAIIVQTLDILKGLLPVAISILVVGKTDIYNHSIIAVMAVLGHIYSPFLKFKGGKGINTELGSFFLLCPIPVLLSTALHIALKKVIEVVAIRSIILALSIPLLSFVFKYDKSIVISSLFVAIMVIFAHRENIKILLKSR